MTQALAATPKPTEPAPAPPTQKLAAVIPPVPRPLTCDTVMITVSGNDRCIVPGDGQVFKDCPECPEMVVVPAGSFTMGSPDSEPERSADESPQRKVTFAKPFAVGRYAVTFAEWDACEAVEAADGCNGHKPSDRGWGRGSALSSTSVGTMPRRTSLGSRASRASRSGC